MTFTIPSWLLWTLAIVIGVSAAIALIAFAVFGFAMAKMLSGGIWR